LPGADVRLRHSNLRAFSEVEAGIAHLLYGRLEWSFAQLFPDTAEAEYLDRWASIWGIARIPAARAEGIVGFPADPGATVPAGALMRRADNVQYRTEDGGTEHNGAIQLHVECTSYGATGNADPGTQLVLMTTFIGVGATGEVGPGGLAGGANAQSDELLLQAVLTRIQLPPHGGAAFDYVRWALEVPGVTRAWVYPLEQGAGTVVVRFMMDEVRAPTGIPTPPDVQLVAEHIDAVRPVTAKVTVAAPIAYPVAVHIRNLALDTPAVREGIEHNLRQLILEEAEPGKPIYLSQWNTAIGLTAQVQHFILDQPATMPTPLPGQIITFGGVTYS